MHRVETIIIGSTNNEHQTCDYIDNTLEEHVKSAAVPIVEPLLKLAMHLLLADINLANQNIQFKLYAQLYMLCTVVSRQIMQQS